MNDVVIIGGGRAGRDFAVQCLREGLQIIVVEAEKPRPHNWQGIWIEGRGVMSGRGLVAILDPVTADERRMVVATAVVWAVGAFDPAQPFRRMLGVTKLGVEFSEDGTSMVTDRDGRTRAEGIYALGECASVETPGIFKDLLIFCNSRTPES